MPQLPVKNLSHPHCKQHQIIHYAFHSLEDASLYKQAATCQITTVSFCNSPEIGKNVSHIQVTVLYMSERETY